jgi:hypothetical protein
MEVIFLQAGQYKNKPSKFELILSFILILFVFFVTYFLTKNFIIRLGVDYPYHISHALHLKSFFELDFQTFVDTAPLSVSIMYPGWHLGFLFFYYPLRLFGLSVYDAQVVAASLFGALLIAFTMLVMNFVLVKFLKTTYKYVLAPLLSIAVIFAGPFSVSAVNPNYYLGQIYSGVWHNPTSQPLKPLIILIAFLFIYMFINKERLQSEYFQRKKKSFFPFRLNKLNFCFIALGFLLALSMIFKTSLILVVAPALFVFCLIDFISSKFKSFKFCFKTGLSIIPACLIMIFQSVALGDWGEQAVIFAPMLVWNNFTPHPFMSAVISLIFPIFVIAVCWRRLYSDKFMFFSLICIVISIATFALLALYPRWAPADFAWGMHVSALLLFTSCTITFFNYINEKKNYIVGAIGILLLLTHFFYGGRMFIILSKGGDYLTGWIW